MSFLTRDTFWQGQAKEREQDFETVSITTEPDTDLWQRTYYGFQRDNAPALLSTVGDTYFSLTIRVDFAYRERFDQCGIILYQDSDHWMKASIEYENETFQRLGSVVTNHGFSDWATTDIPSDQTSMYYRLSRREGDFCVEHSVDGVTFRQMRIFHLMKASDAVHVGVYACSPEASSFTARFSEMALTACLWKAHE